MAVVKKQEQNEQNMTDERIRQAEARIAQLNEEKVKMEILLRQIKTIFEKESNIMNVAVHDLENGDNVLAGMKFRELSEIIESNNVALGKILGGEKQ